MSDPRVFFAAERTLLAWVRTGLSIMGLGFVVARFGLFLRLVSAQHGTPDGAALSPSDFSNVVGICLVLLGAAALIIAAVQHRSYVSSLPPADLPTSHNRTFPVLLSLLLGVLGIALAVYLAI